MMKKILVVLFICIFFLQVNAQKKISFIASDGLEVMASMYLKNDSLPFIILLHQAGSSKGEYIEIAKRLLNLNYNCLAVDLRYGSKMNYVINEDPRLKMPKKCNTSAVLSMPKKI